MNDDQKQAHDAAVEAATIAIKNIDDEICITQGKVPWDCVYEKISEPVKEEMRRYGEGAVHAYLNALNKHGFEIRKIPKANPEDIPAYIID